MIKVLAAIILLQVTGPDGQVILLDPNKVTTLRSPRSTEHFSAGTKCIIFTVDGKNVNVQETCAMVREALEQAK